MESRRLALVTGATSGIGRAFAERLARDGHDLIITGRRRPELKWLAADISARAGIDEQLAMEVRDLGIRVQSLCPGLVDTDFHRRSARGRVLCVPGVWNRVGVRLVPFIPRRLYAAGVRRHG